MWSEFEDSVDPSETEEAGDTDRLEIPNERRGLAQEFADFIVHNAAWWMVPIVVVLAGMVAFILLAEASPVLPFIYTVI
ncbi:MAG TPA: hypothetical protein DFR83_23080 [Deltaproteobacteria bacterium]|nr:hypothetical protein [Deltaproteobacteria bacterium]